MNEEKYIEEKVGRRNPFTVPEGYFDTFADQLMASLPERQPRAKHVWMLPMRYAAARPMSISPFRLRPLKCRMMLLSMRQLITP